MYSIVMMAAVGTGPAAPAADVTPPAVVLPGSAVAVIGCSGCTGYAVGTGCCGGGSCHGCYGSGHRGGLFGHKARGGCHGGLFGHHNKTSCHGCTGYSCSGYSCFGSYAGCSGCYGSCYGHGYSYSSGCVGSCYGSGYGYGLNPYSYGCAGSGYGYGCAGGIYPSYSYPYSAPAVTIPVETKPADGTKPEEKKADEKKGGTGMGANLKFRLPAGAALFVDGRPTPGAGAERAFFTPVLEAGQKYFYDVRAEVTVGGRTVTEDRRVVVEAGAEYTVEFPKVLAAVASDSALAGK